jgi:hypothetical protein
MLGWLVGYGASPDVKDNDGESPRWRASRKHDERFSAALGGH